MSAAGDRPEDVQAGCPASRQDRRQHPGDRGHEGGGREAERWAGIASGFAARRGGWWSPAFESARHVTLTAREREIAGLIELGFTNREIGRRLCISVRTVENHAASVYVKLGVHSRDDLRMAWGC